MITGQSIRKGSSDKQHIKNIQTCNPRFLTKIKFNISKDNLRPFLDGRERNKTIRKKPVYKQIKNTKVNQVIDKIELDDDLSVGQNEEMRRKGYSPDVFRQLSNQIIQKIQLNGIKCEWWQADCDKHQQNSEELWSTQSLWCWSGFSNRSSKTHSFASTCGDPYFHYNHFGFISSHYYNSVIERPHFDLNSFVIDLDNVDYDCRTTIMIKNIPNKYTILTLAKQIDQNHIISYDFLYLPCDIKNNCNVGYGFINFVSTAALKQFYLTFNQRKWSRFRSQKICLLTYARLQGLDNLIEHFQNSKVLNKDRLYQPIIRNRKEIESIIEKQQTNN